MKATKSKPAVTGSMQVDAFMTKLKHPLKADIAAVRGVILEVSPAISEEIKWNAPGFRTTESFATVNLRETARLQFIFHLGAKVRKDVTDMKIADPAGLITKWLGKDRCLVTLGTGQELAANRAAFQKIIRAWLKHL